MWKITLVFYLLGEGTSFVIGLLFSGAEMFLSCLDGHDIFCIGHLLSGWPIRWDLFRWPWIFYGLPGGILAGFIGIFLNRRLAKTDLHSIGFGLLTVIHSFFLSGLLIIMFW